MLSQPNLLFLREKILDLKNAIFISQHSSLLKMATTIVSIEKMDELGQLWFFVPRPQQALHEFDREFPVRLEFFRKGRDFFLHASGKAYIVTDPEDINGWLEEDIREKADDRLVLIRVNLLKAEYFQSAVPPAQTRWWRDLRNQLHVWLFNSRPGYKPYHLADVPLPLLSSYRPVA
jgi:hypothetical protein